MLGRWLDRGFREQNWARARKRVRERGGDGEEDNKKNKKIAKPDKQPPRHFSQTSKRKFVV